MTSGSVIFYDGSSSRKRSVTLQFGATLDIVEDGAIIASWAYDNIRRAEGRSDVLRLSAIGAPELARLEIHDDATAREVIARAHQLDVIQKERSSTLKIVGWSLAAAVSIVLVIVYGMPYAADQLTPLIPQSFERRLGDVAQRQVAMFFETKACDRTDGKAAFNKLVTQVRQAGGLDTSATSAVVDSTVPNAIALPGGTTYLFRGLLDKAQSPDEIAAVVAHELGHVAHRDHLRAMIHNGGTSYLIGLLFGDVTGAGAAIFAANAIFNASHSRDSEQRADGFAIDVMHRLGRSPKGLGELLNRVAGKSDGKGGPMILSSHPLTAERLARMRREDRPATGPDLLTPAEWKALKGICG